MSQTAPHPADQPGPGGPAGASLDAAELAKFAAMAQAWWDPRGKFAPLHRLNPTRIAFIRDRAAARLGRDPLRPQPLAGVRLLDIGCGGGLICEPMARLGAAVTGIDPVARNIAVARSHAEESGLAIDYREATVEELAAATPPERFDVVLALEVVEHVADLSAFIAACAAVLAPQGILVLATINRTAKAFLLAVVGAEYILGWLPRGTHDWRKFVRPSELAAALRGAGLTLDELTGVAYDPMAAAWRLSRDLDVNYMALASR
ncbi:MAG: bifunctional 2-polyprenyl-6-hydroxyphenol methylase/3-demethylubiquinol 3-O-methyltransferase UbiG [Rhodospirillaceae bacterium]|nr:bifunctional 2-polyprenyl-6-hydroxyphenol methylase/3-demethylubiquinol 3-O-methyltransferase UbiG [Rhodospirillaceae bacterium]